MNIYRLKIFRITAVIFSLIQCFQITEGFGANGGRLFALAFQNMSITYPAASSSSPPWVVEQIHISSFYIQTLVKITIPQINYVKVISLDSSNSYTYRFDSWVELKNATDISNPFEGLKWPLAVMVAAANGSINVHVNKIRITADGSKSLGAGYLALPLTTNGGCNYFIASYKGNSALTVVGIYNDTCIAINKYMINPTTATFQRYQYLNLQAGEVYSLILPGGDLTGFSVEPSKPISVFGGVDYTQIPNNLASTSIASLRGDAIMEQMPCTYTSLGQYHVMVNFAGRKAGAGFVYRIIGGSSDNINSIQRILELNYNPGVASLPTVVSDTNPATAAAPSTLDPTKYIPLYKGNFISYTAGVNAADKTWTAVMVICYIQCEVAQYNPSSDVTGTAEPTDPFMILVPAIDKGYTQDITFSTSNVTDPAGGDNTPTNYMTVVARDGPTIDLRLDGVPLTSLTVVVPWQQFPANTAISAYWFSVYQITPGFHVLTTSDCMNGALNCNSTRYRYNAFIYGHGSTSTGASAYGYAAGFKSDGTIPAGPWYDMSLTPATPAQTTAAPAVTTPSPTQAASLSSQMPAYLSRWEAHFSTVDTTPNAKTIGVDCSNAYGLEFLDKVTKMNSSTNAATQAHPMPTCASGVTCNTSFTPIYYYSQPTTYMGNFTVRCTASGPATLGDISNCANNLKAWIKDPTNWVDGYNKNGIGFLVADEKNYPGTGGCAKLFLLNLQDQGMLVTTAQGWQCPQTLQTVYGSSGHRLAVSTSVTSLAVTVGILLQLVISRLC